MKIFRKFEGRHGHHHGFGGRRGGGGRGFFGDWPDEGRTRRGDIKFHILELLAERPSHGYDIMRTLEERRGSRPSPGSVYPTLQMLEDGSFVTGADVAGKRVFTITDEGRALLAARSETPDEAVTGPSSTADIRNAAMKLGAAVMQGARAGDSTTHARMREILDQARREIYALLGDDE